MTSCSNIPIASPYFSAASEYFFCLKRELPSSRNFGILANFSSSVRVQFSFSNSPCLSTFSISRKTLREIIGIKMVVDKSTVTHTGLESTVCHLGKG